MAYDQTSGTIDMGFLPPNFNGDVQSFFTNNNGQGSFKWVKPRGVTMCYMICIGGGGGGGGGLTGATTTARGGGAGGACSSVAKMLIPALFLPDALSIQVGNGGVGKGSGVAGNSGTNSIISYGVGLTAIGTIPNIILQSNNAAPAGGQPGTSSGNASGGGAPSIFTQALSGAAATWGIQNFIVGLIGATGGAPTAGGTNVTATWNLIGVSPGAGGAGVTSAGTSFAGGGIVLQAALDFADGTVTPTGITAGGAAGAGGTAAGGVGNSGVQLWKPFYGTGGGGGGSSDAAAGGNGGNGGIGCGGGGGGAGTTGGTGGNGGDGCVIIISW